MAVKRGIAPPPIALNRVAKLSAQLSLGLLLVVYVIVRVDHFMPAH